MPHKYHSHPHSHSHSTASFSSNPSPSPTKKIRHLFHLRDPAVQAQKNQFAWGSHLGSGTYGEVSRCVWKTHKPRLDVAIKIVPKSKIRDQEQQERLLRHAGTLKHAHTISLHHWFHSRHHYYIVLEFAEGGELFDHIIAHGRFNDAHARQMIADLTDAIAYIHSLGIVHRDLKPENLFVRGKPPLKPPFDIVVADFGVSVLLQSPSDRIVGVCGSPGYTAPEVYRKEPYGKPVDLWSLGVITFVLLCGRFPFSNLQGPAFLKEVEERNSWKFPKSLGLSEAAEDFIMACLRVNPQERISAEEALNHRWLTGTSHAPSLSETQCGTEMQKATLLEENEQDVEVIDFPSPSAPSTASPELAEVTFCRTRTLSEGPRSAM